MDSQEAQIEFEAVLQTLVDGVIIINKVGIMSLFNPACVNIFGFSEDEVLGQNVKMLMPSPFHEEHDEYISAYKKTGDRKIIGIGREVRGRRKDGTIFPMDLAVGETRLDGEPIFVGIIRDLSAKYDTKKKYDQLQQEHFHLSRVAAMNEMGSAIAHELNQPLAASANYIETVKLLLGRGGDLDTDKLLMILTKASEQTNRASEIVSRMRGFIERGEVEKQECNLRELIDSAVRLAFLSFDNQDMVLSVDVSSNLPPVFVNNIQIQQVLVNLIKNACEAMFDSERKALHISSQRNGNGLVEVMIADTGHGLSESDMESLFVPFSSGKSDGMGVGLSISQSIISHHGGQIWARQNKPQGTVFHFTLPLSTGG